MQNFQRVSEGQASAGHKAKGVISGVGKGIMGVFTKPIGGAAELVSQTGYGEFLHFQHLRFNSHDQIFKMLFKYNRLCLITQLGSLEKELKVPHLHSYKCTHFLKKSSCASLLCCRSVLYGHRNTECRKHEVIVGIHWN